MNEKGVCDVFTSLSRIREEAKSACAELLTMMSTEVSAYGMSADDDNVRDSEAALSEIRKIFEIVDSAEKPLDQILNRV